MVDARTTRTLRRQMALIVALSETRRGLTRAEIEAEVEGYRPVPGAKPESSEARQRRFERDKHAIRAFGVPLVAVPDPSAPSDNKLTRYRIEPSGNTAGDAFDCTDTEAEILAAAAEIWRRGALAPEAARALTKIRARGARAALRGDRPAVRLREPSIHFADIARAIHDGRVIAFLYSSLRAAEPVRRRLEPHALVQADGEWLVGGYDLDREAERRFLLRRIIGEVTVGDDIDLQRRPVDPASHHRTELAALRAGQRAEVQASPGSDADIRLGLRGDRNGNRIAVPYTDEDILAGELAAFGDDIVEVTPASLRQRVIARHEWMRTTHAPGPTPATAAAAAAAQRRPQVKPEREAEGETQAEPQPQARGRHRAD